VSIGVYVHLPFCRVHCTYCPFAISTDIALQDAYVAALVREIASRLGGAEADSIYFGGGTPSRTSIENLRRVVEAVGAPHPAFGHPLPAPRGEGTCETAPLAPPQRGEGLGVRGMEFSIEANPEDITAEALAAWRELGVNRISIGVQSFNDAELLAIGRIHDAARAREAVEMTVAAGFRTSLDLILGLPRQTATSFESTLGAAIALGAGHLSLYMLDLEEGTPLHAQVARGRVEVGDDELVASLYARAVGRLADAGLAQYEVSNFARQGEQCRHNLRYWNRGEYHGFGLGAHSFIGDERFANTRNIRDYIADPERARDFAEHLGDGERRRELLFLGLRQTGGMYTEDLTRLGGEEANEWIERGLRDGWLRQSGERVAFTSAGFLLSNDYISQLF
jgi:oxygen-independent coproporphyrinogen-3 oxidase